MADIETGLIGGVGGAIVMGVKMLIDFFRKRDDDRDGKDGERDQWTAINKVREELSAHRQDDTKAFAELNTKMDRAQQDVGEMKSDIKVLLRRSTDQIKRDG